MDAKSAKPNRTDRRSQRTRKLLRDALMDLMLEKRYESITVQDVVDRADVGRSTFYAHYEDKDALFVSEFERTIDSLDWQNDHSGPGTIGSNRALVPSLALFKHVQAHHQWYKALLWSRGVELLFRKGHTYITAGIEHRLAPLSKQRGDPTEVIPAPIIANYLTATLISLLRWWLDNDMPYSPEQMDKAFQQLAMPGVRAALGITT